MNLIGRFFWLVHRGYHECTGGGGGGGMFSALGASSVRWKDICIVVDYPKCTLHKS